MQDISSILAKKATDWYCKSTDSTEDLVIIKYGMELIIENIMKSILLIIVAIITNKVLETILVIGVFSLLRIQAGGIHMKSGLGCSLSMIFVWIVGVFGSKYFVLSNTMITLVILLSIIALYLYAPNDTKNNPITDNNIRNRKKIGSILLVMILAVLMIFFIDSNMRSLIVIPLILEIITILPIVNYINQKRLKEEM